MSCGVCKGEMDVNGGHVQAILLTSTKAIKWCLQREMDINGGQVMWCLQGGDG